MFSSQTAQNSQYLLYIRSTKNITFTIYQELSTHREDTVLIQIKTETLIFIYSLNWHVCVKLYISHKQFVFDSRYYVILI